MMNERHRLNDITQIFDTYDQFNSLCGNFSEMWQFYVNSVWEDWR
jgi:hypothetical protein